MSTNYPSSSDNAYQELLVLDPDDPAFAFEISAFDRSPVISETTIPVEVQMNGAQIVNPDSWIHLNESSYLMRKPITRRPWVLKLHIDPPCSDEQYTNSGSDDLSSTNTTALINGTELQRTFAPISCDFSKRPTNTIQQQNIPKNTSLNRQALAKPSHLDNCKENNKGPISREIMTLNQVADYLQVSTKTVRRLVADNKLNSFRLCGRGHHRFLMKDVLLLHDTKLNYYDERKDDLQEYIREKAS